MLDCRPIEDLVAIASAGGGFALDMDERTIDELESIATAASTSGARIVLVGGARTNTRDLLRIAQAGGGTVSFE